METQAFAREVENSIGVSNTTTDVSVADCKPTDEKDPMYDSELEKFANMGYTKCNVKIQNVVLTVKIKFTVVMIERLENKIGDENI
ncbi:hypothetical protein POVCU2_0050210 [Plasmodium ovale curtisi]|uniref:Uncharacterized protein n=1 Tax=Plasmodium ovale curtisi TaxID=864141 RepID=A0A1A8W7F9_PLAOA|nr:hypothetical protein POVCU2_0050210 [Plasmodium ovale curtisi]SBS98500.1 hypothetical protein POVCU1_046590 [Plasmodium ovale curtisi]